MTFFFHPGLWLPLFSQRCYNSATLWLHLLLELWYCSCLRFLLCCTFNTYLTRIGITLLWEVVFIWRKMERLFLFSIAWLYQRLPASTSPYVPSTLAWFLVNILYMVLKTKLLKLQIFNYSKWILFWLYVYATEKPSPWMCVDTALYVVMGSETKEDSNLVCLTELRDKEVGKCVHFLSKYNSIYIVEL